MTLKEDASLILAPNYHKSFMVPREQMPQIEGKQVLPFLKSLGVEPTIKFMKCCDLKPTQSEFNPEKIRNMPAASAAKPILVSQDNYVLDGHHRWIANERLYDGVQPCYIMPWNAAECLAKMHAFEGSFVKSIHEDGAAVVSVGGGAIDNTVAPVKPKKKLIRRKM